MAEMISSKDKLFSVESPATPIRYKRTSAASHGTDAVPSTSRDDLEVSGMNPVTCKTRVEQLEIEFLMALDALSRTPEENVAQSDLLRKMTHQDEEPQSRFRLARKLYKTELWKQHFEPVLQRVQVAAAAMTRVDLEENAKSAALHRLMASGCVVREEKDVLDRLLGECVRMGAILGDVGLFLGVPSDDFYGTRESMDRTPIQKQEQERKTVANGEPLEMTAKSDPKDEEIDFRAYCDHIFTSFLNVYANTNKDSPPTSPGNNFAAPIVSVPLIAHLYATVTEHIVAAQLQAENASLSAAMDRERKQLNALLAEGECRNEENLSLAAGLLIEAVQVQTQVERVCAAAREDLGVSVRIREEVARRKGVD